MNRKPKIVTFGTLKGGTGKTTTTFNIAGCLAEEYKVLLIDCDPQANLTQDCGIDITNQMRPSIKDVFEKNKNPFETIYKSPIKELPNLDIIPSNIWLTETELGLVSQANRERILDNYIYDHASYFNNYDYIICDTNPSMGVINTNAFYIAESIILVTDISQNSLTGLDLFDYLWSKTLRAFRKKDNIKAIIFNNCNTRTSLTQALFEYCEEREGIFDYVVDPPIPQSQKIKETSVMHKPINLYQRNKKDHLVYLDVIKDLKQKGAL